MCPSSLGTKTLWVAGLTAAVLMHHSRTASGRLAERFSGSAVGPITVSTSRMINIPRDTHSPILTPIHLVFLSVLSGGAQHSGENVQLHPSRRRRLPDNSRPHAVVSLHEPPAQKI